MIDIVAASIVSLSFGVVIGRNFRALAYTSGQTTTSAYQQRYAITDKLKKLSFMGWLCVASAALVISLIASGIILVAKEVTTISRAISYLGFPILASIWMFGNCVWLRRVKHN